MPAPRKVAVTVKVLLRISVDEGAEITDLLNEMDYSFRDTTGKMDIEDTEVLDWNVEDSK